MFWVEKDISGRARCKHCDEGIEKDSWRVGVQTSGWPSLYHLECWKKKGGLEVLKMFLFEALTPVDLREIGLEIEEDFDLVKGNWGDWTRAVHAKWIKGLVVGDQVNYVGRYGTFPVGTVVTVERLNEDKRARVHMNGKNIVHWSIMPVEMPLDVALEKTNIFEDMRIEL